MEENTQELTDINILDDVDDIDKAIIRYKVAGLKDVDVAEKIEMSRQTVANRQKKLKVQDAITELQKTALQIVLETQSDAARYLRSVIKYKRDGNRSDGEIIMVRDKISASREVLKGVLSEKLVIDSDLTRKIHEYLDDEDLEHIEDEENK